MKRISINDPPSDGNCSKVFLLIFLIGALLVLGCAKTHYLKETQKDYRHHLLRGRVFSKKGQYSKALLAFSKAIEIEPGFCIAYEQRGKAYWKKELYEEAIADFSKAIELNPEEASFYYLRVGAYWKKELYEEAIADCSKGIELDPREAYYYYTRGHCWYLKGDYDKAIADSNRALKIEPGNPEAYHVRGHGWEEKGDNDKAIADFSKAIKLARNHSSDWHFLYSCRGNAWLRKGDYDKAIADFSKGIEFDPENPKPYNQLAWVLATCPNDTYRNGREAVKLAKKAVELTKGKDNAPLCVDTLAAAFAEMGRFDDAVEAQEKAISLLRNKGGDPDIVGAATKHLEYYKARRPWREGL